VVLSKDMTDQFVEAYKETTDGREYNATTSTDFLRRMSTNYKNRLENSNTGHAFYIYTMFAERGKLSTRTVTLQKSEGPYDVAVQQFMAAGKPTSPDCLCLVSAMKFRDTAVSKELKDDRERIRNEARSIVVRVTSGKKLNEVEAKGMANEIASDIKKMIKEKKYPSNCVIGVIIADPDLQYKDGVIATSKQDMERIQVAYKTSQFNVIVLIVAIPSDS